MRVARFIFRAGLLQVDIYNKFAACKAYQLHDGMIDGGRLTVNELCRAESEVIK